MTDELALSSRVGDAARTCLAAPLPSDQPAQLRAVARRAAEFAAAIRRLGPFLLSAADRPEWTGAAAEAFRARMRHAGPNLAATATRYDGYAEALSAYCGRLEAILPRLLAARARLVGDYEAYRRVADGSAPFPLPWPERPEVAAAADALRRSVSGFKSAWDEWRAASRLCSRRLAVVSEADETADVTGWRGIVHAAGGLAKYADPIGYVVLHPSLRTLSTAMSVIGTELTILGVGLLFVFPPAGAACLALSAVLSSAQLALDSWRRWGAHEDVSGWDLAMDAVGALPVGGALARGSRLARSAAREAPATGHGLNGVRTIASSTRAFTGGLREHFGGEVRRLEALPRDYYRTVESAHGGTSGLARRLGPELAGAANSGLQWPGLKQPKSIPERAYERLHSEFEGSAEADSTCEAPPPEVPPRRPDTKPTR